MHKSRARSKSCECVLRALSYRRHWQTVDVCRDGAKHLYDVENAIMQLSYMRNTYKNVPQTVRLARLIAPTTSSSDDDDMMTLSNSADGNQDTDPFAERYKCDE